MAAVGPFSCILATSVIRRGRVSLLQLVRFLVVKLTHSYLNHKFDMSVIFTANYFFGGRRHLHRQRDVFMTNFMNLKIKLIQSFRCTHKDKDVRACVYMSECSYVYEYLYLYCVSKKTLGRRGEDLKDDGRVRIGVAETG
jgi:hypothetical protein